MAQSPLERLKSAVSVKKLLEVYGAKQIKGGRELRSTCPLHGGDNPTAFVFDTQDKLFYCFTGECGGGDVIDFVMQAEEVKFKKAVDILCDMFNVTIDWENETVEENLFRDEARAFIERMMNKKKVHKLPPFSVPKDMEFVSVEDYRGYSKETLDFWKLRYCTEGELCDRIVIPLEDVEKRLVGMTGRATLAEQQSKFMHRPRNLHTGYFLTGLGRNLEHVEKAGGTVKIVEGIFDCMRWWESGYKNVCCPIGVFFTEEHIIELYKAGVTRIEMGFDNDKAGRNGFRKAYAKAGKKFEMYFMEYPDGKDADDCTKEELDKVHQNMYDWYEFKNKYGEKAEK